MSGLLEPDGRSLRVESTRIVACWKADRTGASFVPRPLPHHSDAAVHAPAGGERAAQQTAEDGTCSARAEAQDTRNRESVAEESQRSTPVHSGQLPTGDTTRPSPVSATQGPDPHDGTSGGALDPAGAGDTPGSGPSAVAPVPAGLSLAAVPSRVGGSRRRRPAAGVVDGEQQLQQLQQTLPGVCKFFVNTGSCPRGGQCPHLHPAPEATLAVRKLWLTNRRGAGRRSYALTP